MSLRGGKAARQGGNAGRGGKAARRQGGNAGAERRGLKGRHFGFSARLGLFYAAVFLVMGTQLPYLPLWLDWRGLSAAEISVISSAPLFVRLIATPGIAFVADRHGNHRRVLIVLAWAGCLTLLALASGAAGFWPIFLLTVLFSLFWTTIMPLTETIAMAGVKARGFDYGRMRLWGSLSFILASFAGGYAVERAGAGAAIWLLVAGALATIVCAQLLPRPQGRVRLRQATAAPKLTLKDAFDLLRSRLFLLFLAAAGLIQASHAVFYIFGSLEWRAQGISTSWIGVLWAIGITTEIAFFAFSARVVARLGAIQLILLGALAGVLRWTAMGFSPPLVVLMPLQILHGLTYGASHLGAIHFIANAVDDRQAGTAQALYATITAGAAMGGAMLLAGRLYSNVQGEAYWAMAAMSLASVLLCLLLMRQWQRRSGH